MNSIASLTFDLAIWVLSMTEDNELHMHGVDPVDHPSAVTCKPIT